MGSRRGVPSIREYGAEVLGAPWKARGLLRGRPLATIAALAAVTLTACSGEAPSPTTIGAPSANSLSGAGSVSRSARSGPAVAQDPDLVAKGKVIFEQTTGGVGCQYCHGLDGKGKAEFASPDIRGKQPEDVIQAMATRPLMSMVKLSDSEVRAVVAYLAVLP